MERRPLGNTGESLSVIGFGAIVFVDEGPDFARDAVARAIDAGVNYFDMGPAYGGGEAEERGGPAIESYRDRVEPPPHICVIPHYLVDAISATKP